MIKIQNWKLKTLINLTNPFSRIVISITIIILFIQAANPNNKIILKMKSKDINGVQKSYVAIADETSSDWPCGDMMGFSLEDEERYIFSAASAFNATLGDDGTVVFPSRMGDTTAIDHDKRMTYINSFDRIKNLKVGYTDGAFGEKWTLKVDKDFMYIQDTFNVNFKGTPRVAFSIDNIFYEMLISVQELAKQNELQTAKIDAQVDQIDFLIEHSQSLVNKITELEESFNLRLENKPGKTSIGEINISPNPSDIGFLNIEYSLTSKSGNPAVLISDLQGKTVYQENLTPELSGKHQLNLKLTAGVYLYQLTNGYKKTLTKQIIIQ